ncbi:MAG: ATP-dependent helicase, partial [Anaerolineales bacterium]
MQAHLPFTPTLEQQAIIDAVRGPILVMAPVGTGKTRLLAERVANSVAQGISPSRILCLTFTNRAAGEMSARIALVQPQVVRRLTIKTFHALCAQIARAEADALGIPADFVIYDEEDCLDLLADLRPEIRKRRDLSDLMRALADVKEGAPAAALASGVDLADLYNGSPLQRLAHMYHAALRARHALDFTDLVYLTRRAFVAYPEAAERWEARFDFVQVDEVQDTQLAEYEVVRHLARRTRNLALIGDFDQTIFEWRDAQPAVVLRAFEEDFHPTPYLLSLNHRATRTLIGAADALASSFQERRTECVPADHCPEGEPILVHAGRTEMHEAEWLLAQIRALAAANPSFDFSRTAVLTRTNWRGAFL